MHFGTRTIEWKIAKNLQSRESKLMQGLNIKNIRNKKIQTTFVHKYMGILLLFKSHHNSVPKYGYFQASKQQQQMTNTQVHVLKYVSSFRMLSLGLKPNMPPSELHHGPL